MAKPERKVSTFSTPWGAVQEDTESPDREGNGKPEERDTPSTPLDNCMPRVTVSTQTDDGSAYFANETHVFRRTGNTIPAGYPMRIGDEFPGLPNNLDAALFYSPYTYFFKGSEYWRFRDREMAGTYPRPMSDWGGVPDDVDAAYVWSRNGRIYFTKGNQYYAYYPGYGVTSYYPQPLSHWRGLPSDGVDAAFQYSNGFTYFFKGSNYYRFNDDTVQVDTGYPLNTAVQWLGCNPNELVAPTSETEGDATAIIPSLFVILFSTLIGLCTF
ncbi:matrix metalloproteinase-14-like [Lytechinus pictus]|uniref:matrix metalloproteinase-14-like n=1 Tax=Lytechinus pictus TaxID=7653 RepID=UPI0030B9E9AD